MQSITKFVQRLDNTQQHHPWLGFIYAVIRKYGEDEAAYQGALITYYGFLSLFPLLIVAISLLEITGNTHLKTKVITGLLQYFPIFGQQLHANVHSLPHSGLSLVIALAITLYGARGVADALRHALDHVWQVPRNHRRGFPSNVLISLEIIAFGAIGLVIAEILSSYAASFGKDTAFRVGASLISAGVLFGMFLVIFRLGTTSRRLSPKTLLLSASVAAIGIQMLHSLGGYIITHELTHLTSLYGVFALVLGLMFWIYLQAQVILYSLEIGSVKAFNLWPRSITQHPLTAADQHAYKLYKDREQLG